MENLVSKTPLFKIVLKIVIVICIYKTTVLGYFFFYYNYRKKKMDRLISFTKYRKFELINKEELDLVVDYICGNLNSLSQNYPYWYDMYCYATKTRIVIRHRENNNETALAKLGECVCRNQVINFLQNEDNKCNCNKGCASVYFKAIF